MFSVGAVTAMVGDPPPLAILLDHDGGDLLEGEVFTVEPGLYGRLHGGVRVEDMLVVSSAEPQNLNKLPDGLNWDS